MLFGSLATEAATCAADETFIDVGGGWLIVTAMGGKIVTVAVADFVGSVTEVAVIVTVLPLGTAEGAV